MESPKDEFTYILAPMEDVTNDSFRTLCHRHGADLTFTEMVRLESLVRNNNSTLQRISIKDNTPSVIQIIGINEDSLKQFLDTYKPEPGFAGINFNFGCPSPTFVHKGMGCALVKRIAKAQKLITLVKQKGYSASIKLRLGMNQYEKERKAYLNLIKGVDADYFIVHARHGTQKYAEPADWSIFKECAETGKRIIANGDIKTREHIEQLKSYGLAGVMIGREATKNPAVFDYLKGKATPSPEELKQEYLELAKRDTSDVFQKNILKRLGKDVEVTQLI